MVPFRLSILEAESARLIHGGEFLREVKCVCVCDAVQRFSGSLAAGCQAVTLTPPLGR